MAAAAPSAIPAEGRKKTRSRAKDWEPLKPKIVAWVAEHARPSETQCLCGCGKKARGRFLPGHDAVLREQLKVTLIKGTPEAKKHAETALMQFGWATSA